jgi:hypothetical protein
MRRVRAFDVSKVSNDKMIEVGSIISKYDDDSARAASAGAGTFYKWVKE